MRQRLLTNHGKDARAPEGGDDPIRSLFSQYAHYINGNADLFNILKGPVIWAGSSLGTRPELAKVTKRCLSKGPAAAGCVVGRKHAKMSPEVA
ncbi:unnamed protein product, partial [Discosporangium mesarthrocarpum]